MIKEIVYNKKKQKLNLKSLKEGKEKYLMLNHYPN